MRHIEINLPFGLPPAESAPGLMRALQVPSLAMMLSRASQSPRQAAPPSGFRSLPNELWLARQFGFSMSAAPDTSPPIAAAMMDSFGLHEEGYWFILNPAHIRFSRNRLELSDLRSLDLKDAESHALFQAAKPFFDEQGRHLIYGDAMTWFMRADDWNDLRTSTPDAACGHNLEFMQAEGNGDTAWHRLHNDVQMTWHSHRVNAERKKVGNLPVNALWLWGGSGPGGKKGKIVSMQKEGMMFTSGFRLSGWSGAFAPLLQNDRFECGANELIAAHPRHALLMFDELTAPALANDWEGWLAAYRNLDRKWLAPLLDALRVRKTCRLSLHAGNDEKMLSFSTTSLSLMKFWIKPSLSRLVA